MKNAETAVKTANIQTEAAATPVTGTTEVAATTQQQEAKGGLSIQPAVVIEQAFNFLVLLIALYLILYKPLLKIMQEREKKIKDGIENAEKAENMVKESTKIRQDMIKDAQAQSQSVLESARKSAEEMKNAIVTDAQTEAQKIIKTGESVAEAQKEKAALEMKAKAAELVLAATEKILREKMDAAKDAKMIQETLASM